MMKYNSIPLLGTQLSILRIRPSTCDLRYTYEDHCANLKRPEINPVIVSWIRRLSVVALAK